MKDIEIIPTNTCPPDLSTLAARTEVFASFAPVIQLDVSDGVFTPVTSWPFGQGQKESLMAIADRGERLPFADDVFYETHLMIEAPREIGLLLARAGVKRIIGHAEAFEDENDARGTLEAWNAAGVEAGLALLYHSPLELIDPHVDLCDVVLLMTIATIGKQGAQFEEGSFERIRAFKEKYPERIVEVDGGVSEGNIEDLVRAGASRFGVGSAITKALDQKGAYERLRGLAKKAALD